MELSYKAKVHPPHGLKRRGAKALILLSLVLSSFQCPLRAAKQRQWTQKLPHPWPLCSQDVSYAGLIQWMANIPRPWTPCRAAVECARRGFQWLESTHSGRTRVESTIITRVGVAVAKRLDAKAGRRPMARQSTVGWGSCNAAKAADQIKRCHARRQTMN